MPMPTIPGIPPETWELLLQIIGQLNTSIVELQEQGITTFEQLRQWLMLQGYELVEISEVVGYTVCKTTAVDPTTSNAVATRVATDIATTGGAGTAVAQFTSGGNRTLGLVAKGIAVGACLSLLVSTIGAGLVTDEIKEDLITSADPFTIDGENVPVLIDENGKTHFLDEMVEAIRAKAIELGVFDTNYIPDVIPPGLSEITISNALSLDDIALQIADLSSTTSNNIFTRYGLSVNDFPAYVRSVLQPLAEGHGTDIDDYAYFAFCKQTSIRVVGISKGTYVVGGYNSETARRSASLYLSSSQGPRPLAIAAVFGGDSSGFSASSRSRGSATSVSIPLNEMVYYFPNYASITGYDISSSDWGVMPSSPDPYMGYAIRGCNVSSRTGVEGITPAQNLISAGVTDATKPLTEVIPKLAEGEMSIASPTEDNLENKSNWYPVSINSEDVFTDGATEEDTSTAPDGDVKPDVQPSIIDAIKELIDNLYPDGGPEIPVSDSGDTPPAEPPLISGSANGLWSIYNPTLQQVQDFGAYLWSENILDQITRMFNSPIDAVIGFHMIYCTPIKGAAKNIKCGYLDTGVSSITVANQYATIDCGTVDVPEFYHTALDYVDTKLALYLPFIGIIPLDTAVCMGSTLKVIYRIDILTGTCLAQVKVIKENSNAVMYAFAGNCSVQIPLTGSTYTGTVGALLGLTTAYIGANMGYPPMMMAGAKEVLGAAGGRAGTAQSGSLGSNAGALGIRIPYLVITHPISYDAINYNTQYGYPLNQTVTLGSLSGYTKVKDIHLAGIPCTDDELEQIESLLKDGVIIN